MNAEERDRAYDAADGVRLLEQLGFSFHLDWDDELLIETPETLSLARIVAFIQGNKVEVVRRIKRWAQYRAQQFMGGPLAGKPCQWNMDGAIKCFHVKRACWAVYKWGNRPDTKAYFQGYATSQAKGRKGILREKPKPNAASE